MKQRITFFTLLIFGLSNFVLSQNFKAVLDTMQDKKFSEITEVLDKLYEGKEDVKGSGYKPYGRWKNYVGKRLDENGYIKNTAVNNWNTFHNHEKSASYKASGYQGNWNSLGINSYEYLGGFGTGSEPGAGRINNIEVDPANNDIIYVATPGGGLWKTSNAGIFWEPLTDGMSRMGVADVIVDPSSPESNRTIYILTGDSDHSTTYCMGVFKSVDNGESWLSTGLQLNYYSKIHGFKIAMHPTNHNTLYVALSTGIQKSIDGGLTWTNTVSDHFVDIEFNTANPDIMYASTNFGKYYRSVNGGDSWTEIQSTFPVNSGFRIAIAVTPADPNYVYALFGGVPSSGSFTGIYRSTDGGLTFTLQSTTPNILGTYGGSNSHQSWYDLAIAVSLTNRDEIFTGGIRMWKSTDGGATMVENYASEVGRNIHADVHAIECIGTKMYVATDGGINISTDGGTYWTDITSNMEITQYYNVAVNQSNPELSLGGAQDNGNHQLEGNTAYQYTGGDGIQCFFDHSNPSTIYMSQQKGWLFKTTAIGSAQTDITPPGAGFQAGDWETPFLMDPVNNNIIYSAYKDVYKSLDGGDTWINTTNGYMGYTWLCKWMAIAPSNPDYIYAVKSYFLYRSTDGGNTWSTMHDESNNGVGKYGYTIVNSTDENTIYVIGTYDILKSTDGGATYSAITYNLPDVAFSSMVHHNVGAGRIYLGSDIGVFYLDENTTEWKEFSNGLVPIEVTDLEINHTTNQLYASTYGRGIWVTDLENDCYNGSTEIVDPPLVPLLKSASAPSENPLTLTIEAESFTLTGGTTNDAPWGGPGYGANKAGSVINWVNSGDWVEYPVPANLETGIYKVEYNISTPSDNAAITFSVDDNDLLSDNVPNNGSWDSYSLLEAANTVSISSSNSTIKLTASGSNAWQWNLDNFILTKVGGGDIPVTGVSVSPTNHELGIGGTVELAETVSPSDATNKSVTWSSDNINVATVNETSGLVTAVAVGSANVTVTTNDGGFKASCIINVSSIDIPVTGVTVSPASKTIEVGQTVQLTETVEPSDATDKSVTWSSDDVSVATVNASTGLVTAIAEGAANITVTTNDGGFKSVSQITVNPITNNEPVTIEAESFVETGGTHNDGHVPFGANKTASTINYVNSGDWVTFNLPSDFVSGNYKVEYYISTPSDNAAISFSINDGAAIMSDPVVNNGEWDNYQVLEASQQVSLNNGDVIKLTASGSNAWQWNLDKLVLTKVGGSPIEVTGVTVSPISHTLNVGQTVELTETVEPSDATDKTVTWSSDNITVATVDASSGLVTAQAEGTANITVTTNDGNFKATSTINVSAIIIDVTGVTVAPATHSLNVGQTVQLAETVEPSDATDKTVSWSSDNINVATVDASSGLVTAHNEGVANITVTTNDGDFKATSQINVSAIIIDVTGVTVSPINHTLYVGQTVELTETVEPSDATDKTVSWSSDNINIATVDASSGLVTAQAEGTANITVTTNDGGHKATSAINVIITIPTDITIEAEDFTTTGGTFNDSNIPYGVNRSAIGINWVNIGDWAEYSLTIPEEGQYQVEYSIGNPGNNATVQFIINDKLYLEEQVPTTGGWDNYDPLIASKYLEFQPGTYSVKVQAGGADNWSWNLDKFNVSKVGEVCVPVSLKSQSYDISGYYAGPMEGLFEAKEEEFFDSELSNEDLLNIYPNPASEQFTIVFKVNSNEPVTVELVNVVGELQKTYVNNEVYMPGTYEVKYNLDNLQGGVYLLKYTNGAEYSVQRLVVK